MSRTAHIAGALLAAGLLIAAGCEKKQQQQTGEAGQAGQQQMGQQQPAAEAAPVAEDGTVTVGPLTGTLPEGWESVPPASSMRRAQFMISNPAEGGLPGMVTVFYFGPNAGTVEMNIQRWAGQFKQPGGDPIPEEEIKRESFETGDLEVTIVSFAGTQLAQSMGDVRMHEMPNWKNVSGIVNTPDGPWFFKGTGPEKLMTDQRGEFEQFLRSLRYGG